MFIKNLYITNFRNFEKLNINFCSGINFIVGNNGVGKTNIIEAISILSNIKSFRNISDKNIIQWNKNFYHCKGDVLESNLKKYEIGCFIKKIKTKKYKIDDKEIKKINDYYGQFLTVVFSPLDINIITGSPDLRRKFFDSVFSKIDSNYLILLKDLKKIISLRNSVLKSLKIKKSTNYKELEVWDKLFTEKSVKIINKRIEYLEYFNNFFSDIYKIISEKSEDDVFIKFKYSYRNEKVTEPFFYNNILAKRKKEIYFGFTSLGPQRDDYIIYNYDRLFKNYASQGQNRTAAIAMKLAEKELIEKNRKTKIVILIDDIFSELDSIRKKNLIKLLENDNQVIITLAELNNFYYDSFSNINIYRLSNGQIVKENEI